MDQPSKRRISPSSYRTHGENPYAAFGCHAAASMGWAYIRLAVREQYDGGGCIGTGGTGLKTGFSGSRA